MTVLVYRGTLRLAIFLNKVNIWKGAFFNYRGRRMNSVATNITSTDEYQKSFDIKTFIFVDIETTGLPTEEHNKSKITELSMIAVQAQHISLGVFPRVQNKLSLCFNPRKMVSLEAERLTGYTF